MFEELVSFFESIVSFLTGLWNSILVAIQSIILFFEMLFDGMRLPSWFVENNLLPEILQGMVMFVVAVAIVKLILSLGSFSE